MKNGQEHTLVLALKHDPGASWEHGHYQVAVKMHAQTSSRLHEPTRTCKKNLTVLLAHGRVLEALDNQFGPSG